MSSSVRLAGVASAMLLIFSASYAAAIPLTSDEAKCQKTVATQGRVFFKKRIKALQKCNDDIIKGKLASGTDCTLESKAASKITKAETKFSAKVGGKCTDALVAALDFGGQCAGAATTATLTSCLRQDHSSAADSLIATVYPTTAVKQCAGGANDGLVCTGNPGCPGGTCALPGHACDGGDNDGTACDIDADCTGGGSCLQGKDHANCIKTVGKTVAKQANKRMALVQKCKKSVGKGKLPIGTDCVAESQAKLDKLMTKSIQKIQDKCPTSIASGQLFGGSCKGSDTTDNVAFCALCETNSGADDLIVVQHGSGSNGGAAGAIQITDTADCVDGPQSRCRIGDYLLSNGNIRVVVQDIQRQYLAGIGQFGGQIIDADLVRTVGADRDSFEEWAVSLNIESTAHYTNLTIINDGTNGGPAILRATGVDDLLDLLNPSATIASFGLLLPPTADDFDIPVTVQTDYILDPGSNAVEVETTVLNTSGASIDIFFGEFINGSGQVELFQSGYGFGEPLIASPCGGRSKCNQLANMIGYSGELESAGVSYAYASDTPNSSSFSTSGVSVELLGVDALGALIGAATANFTLEANGTTGDSLTFSRLFIVGDGTISSLIDTRIATQCLPFGTVDGTVDLGGSVIADADVVVLGTPANGPGGGLHNNLTRNVVTHTRTDAAGAFSLTLPPGSYTLAANFQGALYEGAGTSPTEHSITVVAATTVTQNVSLPTTGALRVIVDDENTDPIAARIAVVGFDPSPDPKNNQNLLGLIFNTTGVFGDQNEDGFPFGVAHNRYADASGDTGEFPMEPGSYRVYVSHGTEYSIDFEDVTITAGATTTVNATVERVIDSTGFVSGDFHVHSIDSPDAAISRTDRVIAMLGEGVDFFATTDHGYRADFSSAITSLGVGGLVSTAIGQEITTFDYGHFNAWPLDLNTSLANGGFVDHGGAAPDGLDYPSAGFYSETPATIVALAHADYTGTNTVQINHIHSHFGVDGGSGLGIDTGLTPPASVVPAAARRLNPAVTNYFTDTFDALEVWIGESLGQIDDNFLGQNAGDWMNMINQGIISTGVANSDTHRRFITQSGFPRSMVASLEDDPGLLSQDDVSSSVNAGRVIGTNGPLPRITVHSAATGESGGLDLGRCTGVVACTNTTTCPPCTDTSQCAIGETCTTLPTTITSTSGTDVDITVDVQSPEWAPFDRIEFYINTTTTKTTTMDVETGSGEVDVNRYSLTPDLVHTAGVDFAVSTVAVPGTGSSRLVATTSTTLTGLTTDSWVSVMVVGTDGVSNPLFPVVPNSLTQAGNTTLANLIDGNLGESGMPALAFTNPIFIDTDGSAGWDAPGVQIAP